MQEEYKKTIEELESIIEKKDLEIDKHMKPSEIFEGENSSLKKTYDEAVGNNWEERLLNLTAVNNTLYKGACDNPVEYHEQTHSQAVQELIDFISLLLDTKDKETQEKLEEQKQIYNKLLNEYRQLRNAQRINTINNK